MATFDYSGLASTAERLIARFGRDVQFIRKNYVGDAVTDKPWRGPQTSTSTFSVRAAVLDYDNRNVDGEAIKVGDRRVYVAANALAAAGWGDGTTWADANYPWDNATHPWDNQESSGPDLDDVMVDEGANWKIIRVMPLKPGGTMLLFELQVRSGRAT